MATEDVKQDQGKERDKNWDRMVWKIFRIDDQGNSKTQLERYDDHLVMTVPFADTFKERAEVVKQMVLRNETSPIEYFMYKRLLDPKALAEAMGMTVWRVKRHFKPGVFKKLDHDKWKTSSTSGWRHN